MGPWIESWESMEVIKVKYDIIQSTWMVKGSVNVSQLMNHLQNVSPLDRSPVHKISLSY